MGHSYDDILDLPHPVSEKHPPMPVSGRAAQFLPFAALTGYDAAVEEAARLTETPPELDEDRRAELDRALAALQEGDPVTVTYFAPDPRKAGGSYETVTGTFRRADACLRQLVLKEWPPIALEQVVGVEKKDAQSDKRQDMKEQECESN